MPSGARQEKGRLWIVSELYYPEETSTGHYVTHIAEYLAKRRPVRVLCGQPNYSRRGEVVTSRERRRGVEIFRCTGTTLDKNVLLFRAVNATTLALSIWLHAVWLIRRGDQVVVCTNPPVLPFVLAFACRLKGASYTLRLDDVYPDALVRAKLLSESGWLARALRWASAGIYRRASAIVVIGRDMQRLITARAGAGAPAVIFIPHWADVDEVRPQPRNTSAVLHEQHLGDRFVVGLAGNFGPLQGIEFLLDCVRELEADPKTHFLFVGAGKKFAALATAARDRPNLTVLGQRPRSEQASFLNACDVGVVSLVAGMSGVGVPSRIYNLMAAGRPIIAVVDADSEVAMIVQEEKIGWVVAPGDVAGFVAAIRAAQTADLPVIGARARKAAETRYAPAMVLDQYQRALIE